MSTFDEILARLLADPGTGILPGISDPSIDNVAWHDFSHYELLHEPEYYQPPSGGSGGPGPSGGDGGWLPPVECHDWCPGPDPEVLCVAMSAAHQLDDPKIAAPELQQFLSTVSKTVTAALSRRIGLQTNHKVPEFARLIKAAYESAMIQASLLSRLYETYVSVPMELNRDAMFLESAWAWPGDWCGIIDVVRSDWTPGKPIPPSVFHEVGALVGSIQQGVTRAIGNGNSSGTTQVSYSAQAVTSSLLSGLYDFTFYKPYTTNLGLQLIYRQEWRLLGAQRGEVVRTLPLGPRQSEKVSTKITRRNKVQRTAESLKSVESSTEVTDTSKDSTEVVDETVKTNGWKVEAGGSIGFGGIGINASGGVNEEVTTKVGSTNTFLLESVQKTANKIRMESKLVVSAEGESTFEGTSATEIQNPNDEIPVTYVYSKLQRQYEVFTHLNEVNTVIFVAEDVPIPSNLERWIKDNDWIIAKVLLDDSFRDALSAISQDLKQDLIDTNLMGHFDSAMVNITGNTGILKDFATHTTTLSLQQADLTQEIQRSVQQVYKEKEEKRRSRELYDVKVNRLVEHVRKNILHYCRAVWSQEDSDQRMLRYKKLGITVPTVWEFVIGGAPVNLADVLADPTLLLDGEFQPVPGSDRPIADVINPAGPIAYHGNYAVFYAEPDLRLRDANIFDVLDLVREPYIDNGDPPGFLDPARAFIEAENAGNVPDPIPDGTKEDMLRLVPELRAQYEAISEDAADANGVSERENFFQNNANFTQEYYFDYLFRRQFTRQLVVDTNNLVVDIEVGSGSTLEGFKRLHRYVDVQKAVEERDKLELENERRQERLDADELSDPDIENMTVITGEVKGCLQHDHFVPPGHSHHHGDEASDDDDDDDA